MVPAPSSGFNFTYVEEGKAAPPPAPQQVPAMAMPQYPGMMPAPYPAYGMPVHGMPQQPMMMQPMPIPTSRPQSRQPAGPSLDEFPALGAEEKGVTPKPAEPAKKEKKAPATIIPSVVASKVKK